LATLGEMGFSGNRSARALEATDYKGVEPAMEWLLAHADDAAMDEPLTEEEGLVLTGKKRSEMEERDKPSKLAKVEPLLAPAGPSISGLPTQTPPSISGLPNQTPPSISGLPTQTPPSSARQRMLEARLKELDDDLQVGQEPGGVDLAKENKVKELLLSRNNKKLVEAKQKKKKSNEAREDLAAARNLILEAKREKSGAAAVRMPVPVPVSGKERKKKENEERKAAILEITEKMKIKMVDEDVAGEELALASKVAIKKDWEAAWSGEDGGGEPAPTPVDNTQSRIKVIQLNGEPIFATFDSIQTLLRVRQFVEAHRTDGGQGQVFLRTSYPVHEFSPAEYGRSLAELGLVPSTVLVIM